MILIMPFNRDSCLDVSVNLLSKYLVCIPERTMPRLRVDLTRPPEAPNRKFSVVGLKFENDGFI